MNWPAEIFDAFSEAVDVDPVPGSSKEEVIQYLLVETARRAVWRAKADPTKLDAAYRAPYTPLGSVSVEGMISKGLKAKSMTIKPAWHEAVDRLYAFVADNPQLICDQFKDQQVEYCDAI
ncbi:MAG: hypothetical protein G01um101438_257 [Parcubacteria group bacterium Gr01-1014_38]|nr:MAG: hypothetical protein G01um101438_257 [Parcubacteria group bacterium Gr01-1014_38]